MVNLLAGSKRGKKAKNDLMNKMGDKNSFRVVAEVEVINQGG